MGKLTPFQIHRLHVKIEEHHSALDIATFVYLQASHCLPSVNQT
jgi:hypothetical protein